MKKLPKNFVFIGGGPINIELGQAFARLGSKVTILQGSDRILEKEDLETSALMQSVLENENVRVICNAKVSKFTSSSVVFIESNEEHSVEAEAVFVGIGRIPNTDELELKRAGIQITDSSAIYTDKFMRTSNKHVYAVGDVAGQHMFTHAAEMQAIAVLRNMFSPIKIAYDSSGMNWTTFTDPEVSTFGRNKQELDKSGAKFKVVEVDISEDDRAITENSTKGFLRLFITKRGYILGGTLVSQRSGEIASELVSMMQYRVPLTAALKKTFAYPTGSRIIQSVARSYSANQYKSKYVKRLLRILY
jgi:pyruvate/2-oxoglutarate dehydrogenase complex dihydrolipoamide dehydrogenase (E3) component